MFKPSRKDLGNIFHYVGVVLIALGVCMVVPLVISMAAGEWSAVLDFLVSACVSVGVGNILYFSLHSRGQVTWNQGLVIVALSWLFAMLFAALPIYLSGHYSSFLDACFESMSGLATTGLTLVHDLDHMTYGVNFWRHLIMFLGGQGIVVLVITYFMAGTSTATQMYTGEGRESIMPNVIESSRFIWKVSMAYLVAGTLALGVCLLAEGVAPVRSFFQSSCLFMAGFDTGGFTTQALSVGYYHSLPVELITIVFMLLGMINFAVQYEVWKGRPGELVKNMEVRVLAVSIIVILGLVLAALSLAGAFSSFGAELRRGGYQLISAHSGTGFMTVYGQQLGVRWGDLALLGIIAAMGIGGCACATSGAIKAFRVGVLVKEIKVKTKQALSPASAVIVERFHHIKELTLTEGMARAALFTTVLYLLLYLLGTVVGLLYGYGLTASAFESVSAAGNVGLTTGITGFDMPVLLKVVYIFEMWAGRLEVLAVVAVFAYFLSMLRRGRK
ncbi:MAG: potassium transporter TrkG [Actinomycetota bacterium]|nr:potassium transporter TrkG [Actinomycetota bacterium]MDD5667500.1 potassium transporter TrkG [Actinomycetota bacterium]